MGRMLHIHESDHLAIQLGHQIVSVIPINPFLNEIVPPSSAPDWLEHVWQELRVMAVQLAVEALNLRNVSGCCLSYCRLHSYFAE